MDPGVDLRRLTALRAFAALAVFLHHGAQHNDWIGHDRYLRYGALGVTFFFILSGFVLTWAWRSDDSPRLFYVRRFARIWPANVVALVLGVIVFAPRLTWEAIIANLLLLQAWAPPPLNTLNGVSWSLSVEAFFYALAPVIIVASRRLPRPTFMTMAGALVAATVGARLAWSIADGGSVYLYMQPALRLGEFVGGVMIAVRIQGGWRPQVPMPALLVLTGAVLFAIGDLPGDLPGVMPEILLLPFFAALIAAAASADLRHVPGLLQHRALVYAGHLSFAFYLVHNQVLHVVVRHVPQSPAWPVGLLLVLGTVALTASVAALLHHLVEKPAQRRIVMTARTRLPVPSLR